MTLTPQQELENAIIKKNYHIVCDLFGLSPEQRLSLNAGLWIVDEIKQYQTAHILRKALLKNQEETTSIENYQTPVELPPKSE